MDLRLNNRVFLVTGGSRGIGKSIVTSLLEEGAYVATCSRHREDLESLRTSLSAEAQDRLLIETCDVSDKESVRILLLRIEEEFTRLDGVVANAGQGFSGRVLDTSLEDYLSQYEIKLSSVLHVIHAALPMIRKSDAGRIVIMNSVTAGAPDPSMAAVSAARAAVLQVAKMLAIDLAADRICVNLIHLGAIETERQFSRYQSIGLPLSYDEWSAQEARRRGILFGRFGKPEEIAPQVLLLLSPLSSYITGSSIDIAGGIFPINE